MDFALDNGTTAADMMEFVLDRAREFLGATCDPQLRLVSRRWRDALAAVPREVLRVEDYPLSSASLFVWAREELHMPKRADSAAVAARGGHLDVLRWLRAKKGQYIYSQTYYICKTAAEQGHLHVLEWLWTNRPPVCQPYWDARTFLAAAEGGHLNILQWLRAQDPPCPWTKSTCRAAAEGGHLEVLQWLRTQDPPCPWDVGTCTAAAKGGQLEVLQWLRAQVPPCPWGEMTCYIAAGGGQLEVLQWMRAQDPPCPWNKEQCLRKASGEAVRQWITSQPE